MIGIRAMDPRASSILHLSFNQSKPFPAPQSISFCFISFAYLAWPIHGIHWVSSSSIIPPTLCVLLQQQSSLDVLFLAASSFKALHSIIDRFSPLMAGTVHWSHLQLVKPKPMAPIQSILFMMRISPSLPFSLNDSQLLPQYFTCPCSVYILLISCVLLLSFSITLHLFLAIAQFTFKCSFRFLSVVLTASKLAEAEN